MGPEMILVAAAATALGSISQGVAAQRAAEFNAQQLEQEARLARETAAQEEADFRRKARLIKGSQRAGYGAAGVISTEGSPLLVQEDFAREAELEARRIRFAGTAEEARQRGAAAAARFEGEALFRSSVFQAAGSLATGGYRYDRIKNPPPPPPPPRRAA